MTADRSGEAGTAVDLAVTSSQEVPQFRDNLLSLVCLINEIYGPVSPTPTFPPPRVYHFPFLRRYIQLFCRHHTQHKREEKSGRKVSENERKNKMLLAVCLIVVQAHEQFPQSSSHVSPDQISTGVEYLRLPMRTSGARYHSVTTSCVYERTGIPNARANPKSASLS